MLKRCSLVRVLPLASRFGELPFGSALFACQTFADLILAVCKRTELRSRQTPLADLASDRFASCLFGSSLIFVRIPSWPFAPRGRATLFTCEASRLARAMSPVLRPEMRSSEQPAAPGACFTSLRGGEAALLDVGVVRIHSQHSRREFVHTQNQT